MNQQAQHSIQILAAALFAAALLHTFAAKQFERLALRFPRHAGLLHLLGEVEVVFGFWSMLLVIAMAVLGGGAQALAYAESRQYTEPLFVFVVMVIAASRPVVHTVFRATQALARRLPLPAPLALAWLGLAVIPLVGSLITEPAAMTIGALMLGPQVFRQGIPERLKYFALGVLFVNISIGGTMTSFAAPPVLMVAGTWGWTSGFMFMTFGWKAAVAVLVNATLATALLRRHLRDGVMQAQQGTRHRVPPALALLHFGFLAAVVALAHHPVAFLAVFLMFLGFAHAYERHHSTLILREALLVAFFLAGLVVLGGMQEWWLQPLVARMSPGELFFGTTALTAIADNAALTYLGSLIEGISDDAKYSLVAGAVTGGGLTVIANAPNPAGVALLRRGFEDQSIGAAGLLLGASVPTLVALAAFMLL
ncbi:putative Na+/H+ antiporter [Ramlibacter sp.]|uniref:putative Na+/H+ antiporter n=1 Tax=Ramlibacter sp. TaxID=1917967 RepID=UPI002BD96F60|nr:putative Na+/H+ antiporter [Ramlibacter sp.]HWI83729.1 putative Na+/H+ antiporter [Ramlibacter sp.]